MHRRTPLLRALVLLVSLGAGPSATAQSSNARQLTIHVTADDEPLEQARVSATRTGSPTTNARATTTSDGRARLTLPAGQYDLRITRIGFGPESLTIAMGDVDTTLVVELHSSSTTLSDVVVTSTRGARRLEEEPTRVEVLGGEDVAEKTEMRPADITGFLSEMGGVRVQRTSAASQAGGVRLQGLRPHYTLMLSDGLPLYGTGSSGLDLLQLPPADLKQIEVIKGAATALYGPAALGGTINLISKRPPGDPGAYERDLLVSQSTQRGTNALAWNSQAINEQWGFTVVAGGHNQPLRDTDHDGWADIPGVKRVEIRPRLFHSTARGDGLLITAGGVFENRAGGTLGTVASPYRETLESRRGDVGVTGHSLLGDGTSSWLLQYRAAGALDAVSHDLGGTPVDFDKSTGFAELSASRNAGAHSFVIGSAVQRDGLALDQPVAGVDYTFYTGSAFAQDAITVAEHFSVTASGRLDQHSRYGSLFSPRLSALVTLPASSAGDWSIRGSVARGRSAPLPFVEETQTLGLRSVRGFSSVNAETSDYASIDVTGHTGPLQLDGTLFASRISNPVRATIDSSVSPALLRLANNSGDDRARGAEIFGVVEIGHFLATALYTFTDASEVESDVRVEAPFAPRHTGGIDLAWEDLERGSWIALEAFHTGHQRVEGDPTRATGEPYNVVGLLISQQLGPVRVFMSGENLANVRQSHWSPVLLATPSRDGRRAVTPWAPLEGRVLTFGVRLTGRHSSHSR